MGDLVVKSISFIAENATLGQAKQVMEETPNCQDVFVTATGNPIEPIIGWLTNVDIQKYLKD